MTYYKNIINTKWLEASILGTIWGTFEIIIGSFLHNIRFPLSGTILASISVMLLISYAIIYKKKGIFWRAGIIAALLKSISPSAILLGPMTGIMLEAFIIEFFIFLTGFNVFSYLLSAVFALLSVIIHKIITLLVLYGFNIVKISENLYYFVVKQINVENLNFYQAIGLLLLIYVILGLLSAFAAYFIAFNAKKINKNPSSELNFELKNKNFDLKINKKHNYSTAFIILNLFSAIFLIILSEKNLYLSVFLSFLYLGFVFYRYKNNLGKLKKLGLWFQFLILFIVSAIFFENQTHFQISTNGILAGIKMILRSLVIIFSFSAISFELRNPLIKIIMYKNGFRDLYTSLSLGFSVIPILTENFKFKNFVKSPFTHIAKQLILIKNYASELEKMIKNKKIIVITGEINSGKTTKAIKLARQLEKDNLKVCGFVSISPSKEKKQIFIKPINSDDKFLLCSTEKISELKVGRRYYFNPQTIELGNKILKNSQNCDILIIDEIGILELQGKGWSEGLEYLLEKEDKPQIWVVRKNKLTSILKRFGISEAIIFDNQDIIKVSQIIEFFNLGS